MQRILNVMDELFNIQLDQVSTYIYILKKILSDLKDHIHNHYFYNHNHTQFW